MIGDGTAENKDKTQSGVSCALNLVFPVLTLFLIGPDALLAYYHSIIPLQGHSCAVSEILPGLGFSVLCVQLYASN